MLRNCTNRFAHEDHKNSALIVLSKSIKLWTEQVSNSNFQDVTYPVLRDMFNLGLEVINFSLQLALFLFNSEK